MNRKLLGLVAMLVFIFPLLAACGGGDATNTPAATSTVGSQGAAPTDPPEATTTTATDEPTEGVASPGATGGAGTATTDTTATAGGTAPTGNAGPVEGEGGPVTVMNQWTGTEKQGFEAVIKFCDTTYKTKVKNEQVQSMSQLPARVQGGNPPDLATVSSPGQVQQFAKGNAIKPLDFLGQGVAEAGLPPFFVRLGTVNDKLYTVYMKSANKSLIWYSPKRFKAAGYQIPKTYDELVQLSEKMVQDGKKPWAFGTQPDQWTLTDFFENMYLRVAGPEKYDQLVAHEIPWTDDSVKQTFEQMKRIMGNDAFIGGGRQAALGQGWSAAATSVFKDPPAAEMFQEADFVGAAIAQDLPNLKPGEDFDAFPFPAVGGGEGPTPVVAGPDGVIMFKDTPGARAFVRCLLDPRATEQWAKIGGYTSPIKGVPLESYPSKSAQTIAQTLAEAAEADVLRMDGSDLMPPQFGGDYFWKALQQWFSDPNVDMNAFLQDLERNAARFYQGQ